MVRGDQQTNLKYLLILIIVVGLVQQVNNTLGEGTETRTGATGEEGEGITVGVPFKDQKNYQQDQQRDQEQQKQVVNEQTTSRPQQSKTQSNTKKEHQPLDLRDSEIKVLFCQSSQSSHVQPLKKHLSFEYPQLLFVASEYPLTPSQKMISTTLQYLQYAIFGLGIFGDRVPFLNNNWLYQRVRQHKMVYLMGGYFLINAAKTNIGTTGAFEVFLDGQKLFSKLQTGRIPEANELVSLIVEKVKGRQV